MRGYVNRQSGSLPRICGDLSCLRFLRRSSRRGRRLAPAGVSTHSTKPV
jgi:hypothetical protein